jgi:hypothetical protein
VSGSFAAILPVKLLSDDHTLAPELADSTSAFGNHHIFAAQPPQFQQVKLTSIQVNTHFRPFLRFLFHIFDTLVAAVIFCFMKPEFRLEKTRDPTRSKKTVKLVVQFYRMSFLRTATPQAKLKYVLNFSKCVLFAGEIVNLRVVLNVYMILRFMFACREES